MDYVLFFLCRISALVSIKIRSQAAADRDFIELVRSKLALVKSRIKILLLMMNMIRAYSEVALHHALNYD